MTRSSRSKESVFTLHTSSFIPGKELSKNFYFDVVKPILESNYPGLIYSAGVLGSGSDILGFDTEMSTDHNWGPKLLLFLSKADLDRHQANIHRTLGHELPFSYHGFPTHFEEVAGEPGTDVMKITTHRPINHRVSTINLDDFLRHYLGIHPDKNLTIADWLTIPEQKFRSIVDGTIFHDGLKVLNPLQKKVSYYPLDIWLYLLSAGWQRIGQEEPFVGRAGLVRDDLGSALIAARQVANLMRLAFLIEKTYAPYSKWFGSAFALLPSASSLHPNFMGAIQAADWREREHHLGQAGLILVRMTNQLQVIDPLPERLYQFHDRPFYIVQGERIARQLWDAIQDDAVKGLPFGVGKIDQITDSTDILSYSERSHSLSGLYNLS
jgi:hypothetical protein